VPTDIDAAYDILGVPRGASFEQVHKAWRILAKQVHPDGHHSSTPEGRERAEQRAKRINAAHDLLKDRLRGGDAPTAQPPPTSDNAPLPPQPWFEPSSLDFGRVTMADNGAVLPLDLCNRVGHIRIVTPVRFSGSFWHVEGGPVGRRPVRASFRVILDLSPSLIPGLRSEAITILVEGEKLTVPVRAMLAMVPRPVPPPAPRPVPPPAPRFDRAASRGVPPLPGGSRRAPGLSAGSPSIARKFIHWLVHPQVPSGEPAKVAAVLVWQVGIRVVVATLTVCIAVPMGILAGAVALGALLGLAITLALVWLI
jgi:hypothetical protein